jgi:hypothetical protein
MTETYDTGSAVAQSSAVEGTAKLRAELRRKLDGNPELLAALRAKFGGDRAAALQAMTQGVAAEAQTAAASEATNPSPGIDELLDQLIRDVVFPALPQTVDDVAAIAKELETSEDGIMALLQSDEFVAGLIGEMIDGLLS